MPTPLWILDADLETRMAARSCGRAALSHVARAAGHRVALARWVEGALVWEGTAPVPDDGPAVVHGPFPFVDAVERLGLDTHLSHFDPERFTLVDQRRWLAGKLLNAAATITTLGDLLARPVPSAPVFLRPVEARMDTQVKAFPGKPLAPSDWTPFLDGLAARGLPLDLAIGVAPFQRIHAEARHLVVAGRVVASSLYRFQGALHIRVDTYPAQRALARAVARKAGQPALAYTCDTAVLDTDGVGAVGDPIVRVVEINPFSSSGLYGMDRAAIVAAFGRLA